MKATIPILLILIFAVPGFAQIPVPLGKTVSIDPVFLYDPTSGLPAQADAAGPAYCTVQKNASATPLSVSGAAVVMSGVTTNGAQFSFALTAVNGFTIDDRVTVFCSATVGGVNGSVNRGSYRVVAAENTAGFGTVDVTRFGNVAVTGRDLGASVLLSNGVGTGQIKLAAGYVSPNFSDITGTLDTTEIGTTALISTKFGANFLDANGLATDAATEIAAAVGHTIERGVALANYPVKMFLLGTSTPAPGLTNIDCFMARDGAAAVALTDTSEAEIDPANLPGWYKVDLSATETTAIIEILRCKGPTTEPFEQIIMPEN